jgi:RND family efflux transporter MFP subunit
MADQPIDEEKEKILLEERNKRFQPMAHRSRYVIGSVIALLALLFAAGFISRLSLEKQQSCPTCASLPQVTIIEAKGIHSPVALTLPSSIDAINITPIWSRVDGYIQDFLVDIGDTVKEGQLLAEIETPELDKQYQQTIANVADAQARYNIAKITLERTQGLYQENPEAISRQDVDQNAANVESAKGILEAAKADEQRLRYTAEFKYILAPFDGIIIERDIDIGSLVTAGSTHQRQQLYKIARTNILRVFVQVPQRFFRSIKEGITADIQIREFPEKIFHGFVARYAKALDPIARTLLTEVHILNPHNELYVGLYADVTFHLEPANTYFIIPTSAVIVRAEGPKVAKLNSQNEVEFTPVTLGLDHGKQMEIISGLQEGDRVITNPSDRIIPGAKVEIINEGLISCKY